MRVERLTPDHAAAYRALMLDAYDRHPAAFTSSSAERKKLPMSWWEQRLCTGPQPDELVFGGFDNGALVGAVGMSFEPRQKGRHKACLFGMVVNEQARRRGLGRQLVEAALAEARGRPHVLLVQLTVTDGNEAARNLYQSCGFVGFGTEPYAVAVGTGFVDKLHMWCNLKLPPWNAAASGNVSAAGEASRRTT